LYNVIHDFLFALTYAGVFYSRMSARNGKGTADCPEGRGYRTWIWSALAVVIAPFLFCFSVKINHCFYHHESELKGVQHEPLPLRYLSRQMDYRGSVESVQKKETYSV